jgi:hypothetical protein
LPSSASRFAPWRGNLVGDALLVSLKLMPRKHYLIFALPTSLWVQAIFLWPLLIESKEGLLITSMLDHCLVYPYLELSIDLLTAADERTKSNDRSKSIDTASAQAPEKE